MYDREDGSIIWGLTPFALGLGLFYHVISTACPHWLENEQCQLGLWQQYCDSQSEVSGSTQLSIIMDPIGSWYQSTKILEGLALVCVIVCAISALLRVNHGHLRWQELSALTAFLAGVLSLSGCAVFAFSKPRPATLHLSWAFVFNVFSGFMCLLSSLPLFLHVRLGRR